MYLTRLYYGIWLLSGLILLLLLCGAPVNAAPEQSVCLSDFFQQYCTGIILFSSLLALGMVAAGLYFQHIIRQLKKEISRRKKAEAILSNQHKDARFRFDTLMEYSPDIICFKDGAGRWLDANPADLALFQLEGMDYRGKTDSDLAEFTHPMYREAFLGCKLSDQATWDKGGMVHTVEVIPSPEGSDVHVDVIKLPFFDEYNKPSGLMVIGRDISEHVALNESLKRLNHAYKLTNKVRHILLRADTQQQLLDDICTLIIEQDRYGRSWIGRKEFDETCSVSVLAQAGFGDEFKQQVTVFWSKEKSSLLPMGQAIHSNEIVHVHDTATDHGFQNLKEKARIFQIASVLVLPIKVENKIWGGWAICSINSDPFTPSEIKLLKDVSEDVGFGIELLLARKQLQLAVQKLEEGREQLALTVAVNNLGVWDWRPQSSELHTNEIFFSMLGYAYNGDMAERIKKSTGVRQWLILIHPEDRKHVMATVRRFLGGDDSYYRSEHRLRCANGQWKWILDVGRVVERDEQGQALRFMGVHLDITEQKEIAEKLKNSKQSLAQAQQIAGLGNWQHDFVNNTLDCSAEIFNILEIDPVADDALQTIFRDNIHPDDQKFVLDSYERAIREKESCDIEYRLLMKDGRNKHVHERFETSYTDTDKPIQTIGVIQDITLRKQAEQLIRNSREKYQRLVDDIGQKFVVFSHDNEGIISYVSDGVESVFGIAKNKAIGKRWADLVRWHPDDLAAVLAAGEKATRREVDFVELNLRFTDQNNIERIVSSTVHSHRDDAGNQLALEGIIEDITKQKRVEQQLLKAQEKAEAANQAKSIFLANMSHELRTPMNSILGFSSLLSRDKTLNDSQQEKLATINHSGMHLLDLINDVLDISKIEAGSISVEQEKISLPDLLRHIKDMFESRTHNTEVEFRLEMKDNLPESIRTDRRKIRQILINLLDNSVKFTAAGSIVLRVFSLLKESGSGSTELCFEVEDTGIGISAEEQKELFQPFIQTSGGKTKEEGTGLGLCISRNFARLLNGDITVSSSLDNGSVFTLHLPVETVFCSSESDSKCYHPQVVRLAPGQEEYRILVCDNKEDALELMRAWLEPVGFKVQLAVNGLEAVKISQHWQPHFIWMDIRMPELDGCGAVRKIRADSTIQQPAIVALSAEAFTHDREKMIQAGCNDYVVKPCAVEYLFYIMKQQLDLEYLYLDDPDEVSETGTGGDSDTGFQAHTWQPQPDDIAAIDPEITAHLHQAVTMGDDTEMQQSLTAIESQNSRLAATLRQWIENYEYERILALLG